MMMKNSSWRPSCNQGLGTHNPVLCLTPSKEDNIKMQQLPTIEICSTVGKRSRKNPAKLSPTFRRKANTSKALECCNDLEAIILAAGRTSGAKNWRRMMARQRVRLKQSSFPFLRKIKIKKFSSPKSKSERRKLVLICRHLSQQMWWFRNLLDATQTIANCTRPGTSTSNSNSCCFNFLKKFWWCVVHRNRNRSSCKPHRMPPSSSSANSN